MSAQSPEFTAEFQLRLLDLFAWRRDVRRFRRDSLPDGTIERLLAVACGAPSVGLSQPWRFVIVDDLARRRAVRAEFEACNQAALAAQSGDTAGAYARLKLAGLDEAPCQFAAFADRGTQVGHGLGRHTMPETAEYSVVAAIHTLWLLARAEGIGVGWVSILDAARLPALLDVPETWRFIGYFCVGYPQEPSETPELERAGWEKRRGAAEYVLRR